MEDIIFKKISDYYSKNETKVDLSFFIGGFVFDIFTLANIDDFFSISQQISYLFLAGLILFFEFLEKVGWQPPARLEKIWSFRRLIFHFVLGSLLSIYSLFFLKSASIFTSLIFILFILGLMVVNEMKRVQQSGVDLKFALYVICLFCFFSMLIPVLLGFVGLIPFALSVLTTAGVLFLVYRLLLKFMKDENLLIRKLTGPSTLVLILFSVFYLMGWIPPVPLSIQHLGIYHDVKKTNEGYELFHERPWWRVWHEGDQEFLARQGDSIYVFSEIFSPARFSDTVVLNWQFKDEKKGWVSTDRVPMSILGGRKNGYRGFARKQNFQSGRWRVKVETTDHREIGRIYFDVLTDTETNERVFQKILK